MESTALGQSTMCDCDSVPNDFAAMRISSVLGGEVIECDRLLSLQNKTKIIIKLYCLSSVINART